MAKTHKIRISPRGQVQHIHDDRVTDVTSKLGTPTIRRASHVEPKGQLFEDHPMTREWLIQNLIVNKPPTAETCMSRFAAEALVDAWPDHYWFASMLPCDGPVLGPFMERQHALDAEVKWLHENKLGFKTSTED